MNQDLLERYLYAVTRRLPARAVQAPMAAP